jgi:hypothetical protein
MFVLSCLDCEIEIGVKGALGQKVDQHISIGVLAKGHDTRHDWIGIAVPESLQGNALVYLGLLPALPLPEQRQRGKDQNKRNGYRNPKDQSIPSHIIPLRT